MQRMFRILGIVFFTLGCALVIPAMAGGSLIPFSASAAQAIIGALMGLAGMWFLIAASPTGWRIWQQMKEKGGEP